jgi:hypothetical protein
MLNNFSSFFEIFCGLNLAYAGSQRFRNAIDSEIYKLLKNKLLQNISSNVEELKSKVIVTVSEDNSENINKKLIKLQEDFDLKSEDLLGNENEKLNFIEGFNAMFLSTSLYCLSILILGGYEQFFSENSKLPNLFLIFLLPVFGFNLFVFLRSFTKKHNKNIKAIYTITFVVFLLFLCISTIQNCPYETHLETLLSEKTTITFTLIIAVSPFLFHFIRVFIHKFIFKFKFTLLKINTNYRLKKINDLVEFFNEDV